MTTYPVHYDVHRPERSTRLQLAVRIVALLVVAALGVSFGAVLLFAYVALPVLAAIRVSAAAGPDAYVNEDGPKIRKALHWFAAILAWTGLTAERLPAHSPDETVAFAIEGGGARPTAASAIVRLITGIPSALVLALLGVLGALVWLWAALSILFVERVGDGAFRYLVGLQRWTLRLFTYQASLVEPYPPYSFSEAPPPELPTGRVAAEAPHPTGREVPSR